MNATQILKVAGIEKGKRTKILEKEVLTGEHEKVQGGYGKYQGTWIPCDKGRELAQRYGVLDILMPLFTFEITSNGNDDEEDQLPTKEQALAALRKQQNTESQSLAPSSHNSPAPSSPYFSVASSPVYRSSNLSSTTRQQTQRQQSPALSHDEHFTRKKARLNSSVPVKEVGSSATTSTDERCRMILTSLFLSDEPTTVMRLLKDPVARSNFDVDLVLDEHGHTALHLAASWARLATAELLVSNNADIRRMNEAGETPLMRSVMVTNCHDVDSSECFPKLLELLGDSINATDHKNRTVLHHTAVTAGIPGRGSAALYYMSHVLQFIASRNDLKDIIDKQDSAGDTALSIATNLECSDIVELLVHAGASAKKENGIGLTPIDYQAVNDLKEKENQCAAIPSKTQVSVTPTSSYAAPSHGPSQRGREIVSTVQKIVDCLDDEYGGQLTESEKELQHVMDELALVTEQLETTRKDLEERQAQSRRLAEAQQRLHNLEVALQSEWRDLERITEHKELLSSSLLDNIDENEDIDAFFDVEPDTQDRSRYVQMLQSRVNAYSKNDEDLRAEVERLRAQSAEKEMQCKRLIAACCSLPIEKIDELVEPLTLAIESDPPDLDLARVVGFMEKIRRQGAFTDASSTSSSGSTSDLLPRTTAAGVNSSSGLAHNPESQTISSTSPAAPP
ncbi:transcriptional regulator swi6 [Apophysomyces ossiformis]|uniref:Transcriptional regulator swi6 n=1 Tax=Apophysomyces ossiformis TaxID=679940 RepID=A0A8H7BTU5_9FUNG|nr:transcriptional regulator swi6 [Apophysomyces ossiformis]